LAVPDTFESGSISAYYSHLPAGERIASAEPDAFSHELPTTKEASGFIVRRIDFPQHFVSEAFSRPFIGIKKENPFACKSYIVQSPVVLMAEGLKLVDIYLGASRGCDFAS